MFESLIFQVMAIIFGASIGSFLNVVIYRVPAGISILYPPSRCPTCLKKLSPWDNIPIIGWFLIKGKCRYCRQKVAWRYPFIECLTAFAFWLVVIIFMGQPLTFIVGSCFFLSYLIALAAIDMDTMTLPNPLTQSGLILGIGFHLLSGLSGAINISSISSQARANFAPNFGSSQPVLSQLIASILGAVVGVWLVDLVRISGSWLLQTEAMGAGDAKLAAMIGAWLGWQQILLTLLLAAALGSIVGIFVIKLKNSGKTQLIPFGPFLAIAATFCLFYGDRILSSYLNWFGIS
jgi:leader peptidase (prepilin peptidase) / N-methyltransferase